MIIYDHRRDVKKTRKPQTCQACERPIAKGRPATYFSGEAEGEFYNAYYHPDCRDAEQAWNAVNGTMGADDYLHLWDLFDRRLQEGALDTEAAATFPVRLDSEWPAVHARLIARKVDRSLQSSPA